MLLFVIYAHFSKMCTNYACAFNFKFSVEKYPNNRWITMQKTSKWQTHLPYLHLETLRVHNSFSEHCTEFMQETSTWTPSWVTELVGNAHALTPVERSSINFCRSQVPETIIRQNICYLRSKNGCVVNKWQTSQKCKLCQQFFFRKFLSMKIMLSEWRISAKRKLCQHNLSKPSPYHEKVISTHRLRIN